MRGYRCMAVSPRCRSWSRHSRAARGYRCCTGARATAARWLQVSSVHLTFNSEAEWQLAARAPGWLSRMGVQFHWCNPGYGSFDDFLGALKQSKRKSIRQERKSVAKQGLRIERLRGNSITPALWDAFYSFYINTTGALARAPCICSAPARPSQSAPSAIMPPALRTTARTQVHQQHH
jgi:predicted N-acyltransferase